MIAISHDGLTSSDSLDLPGAGVAPVPARDGSKIGKKKCFQGNGLSWFYDLNAHFQDTVS